VRFATVKELVAILRRSYRPLLLTSLLYRAIAAIMLAPLVAGLAGLFFSASGRLVVANEEIAAFVLQPVGCIGLVIIAACSLALIALEQACLMLVLVDREADMKARIWSSVRSALAHSFEILGLAVRIVLRIIASSSPFIILAGLIYAALLREHDINYYLTAWPPEFILATIGALCIAGGLIFVLMRIAVRVIFALPILLFEEQKPWQALAASRLRSQGHGRSMAMSIGAWGVAVLVISSLTAAVFFRTGRLTIPLFLGHTPFLAVLIGLLVLGLTLCQFVISIGSFSTFSAMIMAWYGLPRPDSALKGTPTGFKAVSTNQRQGPVAGRMVIIGAVIALGLAAATGWLLLSRADLKDRTEVVAHRGASASAPENTLAAVQQTIVQGADWLEIDVQRTADDRVVVVHDRDLMRLGRSPLVVRQATYAQLATIDVGSWFDPKFADQRIPPLEAVLKLCMDRIRVIIELKYYDWDPLLADRVIGIVEDLSMGNQVAIMSLKPEAAAQVKRRRPRWRVGLLAASALTDLTRAEVDFLALHSRMVNPGLLGRAHRQGKTLQVWTINDPVGMTTMFGMGVDAIITDKPGLAVSLLAQRREMDPVERMLVTAGLIVLGDQEHVDPKSDSL